VLGGFTRHGFKSKTDLLTLVCALKSGAHHCVPGLAPPNTVRPGTPRKTVRVYVHVPAPRYFRVSEATRATCQR